MKRFITAGLASCAAATMGVTALVASPVQAADDVTINVVAVNDFHGRIDAATVQWAGTIKQLESEAPQSNSLLIGAGDNVGASLFASAVQQDNPTIDVLNSVEMDATAAGNHEFDGGYDDLVNRIQPRAEFPILGANVKKSDGSDALAPSKTFDVQGLKVAVIGAVTQDTPSLVSPGGVEGLTFGDPVAATNAEVERLNALPEGERPDVVVATFHEGAPDGSQTFAEAVQSSAALRNMVENTSADVDALVMGHTHQKYTYDAPIPGREGTRPVIQTGNYGENVGQIRLQVNPETGQVSSYSLRNMARSTATDDELIASFPDLQEVKQIRDDAVEYADEVGSEPKGTITADITTAFKDGARDDRAAESSLGNVVADALLATVKEQAAGADLGIVNPGGLRSDLLYAGSGDTNGDGVVTYAELNSVLPFVNNVSSVQVSGSVLKKIFEQQWQRDSAGNVPSRPYLQLGTSSNVSYTYDETKAEGSRIQSLRINGEEVDPSRQYKVATFSFLAGGGDNFRAFTEGTNTDTGLVDRDIWVTYFEQNSPVSPSYAKHAVQITDKAESYEASGTGSYTLSKLDLTSLGTPQATRVESRLIYGDQEVDLPSASVTDGSATIEFDLPADSAGQARVESITYAADTAIGTKVVVPLLINQAAKAESTTTILGVWPHKVRAERTRPYVVVKVKGSEGYRPGGTVDVTVNGVIVTADVRRGWAVLRLPTFDKPGKYKLRADYSGDQRVGASSDTTTVKVVGDRRGR